MKVCSILSLMFPGQLFLDQGSWNCYVHLGVAPHFHFPPKWRPVTMFCFVLFFWKIEIHILLNKMTGFPLSLWPSLDSEMVGKSKSGWTGEALRAVLPLSVQSGGPNQCSVSTHTHNQRRAHQHTHTHTQPPTGRKTPAIAQKCLGGITTWSYLHHTLEE